MVTGVESWQLSCVFRQGHSAVVKGNMMFVFGGKTPKLNKPDKCEVDAPWPGGGARWNMCGLLVHARPSTKFFVFGGASSEASENPRRFQTHLCSDIGVLTLAEECHWDFITTISAAAAAAEQRETVERSGPLKRRGHGSIANASQQAPAGITDLPLPREGATMAYFAEDSTLVVFGGWSGKWLGDLWTCCVSSVVGPPYAVLGLSPPCGPMTGGTPITLRGAGFTTGSIIVRFSVGDFFADVPGTFVSSTEIHALTPNVKAALGYSMRMLAHHAVLRWGLGCFPMELQQQQLPQEEPDAEETEAKPVEPPVYLPVSIKDFENGTYLATYTAPRYHIYRQHNEYAGEILPSYGSGASGKLCGVLQNILKTNEPAVLSNGIPVRCEMLKVCPTANKTILHLQNGHEVVQAKVKHDDRRSLLDVRQHIKNVEALRAEHELYIEVLQVALQKLQELGANVDSSNRALKKIGEKRTALEASAEKRCHELGDAFEAEAAKTRKAIEELDTSVNSLQETLSGECFYSFSTSPTEARARIKEVSERTNELLRTMESLFTMEDELRNVTQFWNVAESMLNKVEEYRGLLWPDVDGVQIEIAMDKKTDAYQGLLAMLRTWVQIAPLITELRGPYMRERHWNELLGLAQKSVEISDKTKLSQIEDLNLLALQGAVEEITDKAKQEEAIEKNLVLLTNTWEGALFVLTPARQPDVHLLSLSEESSELLEEQQMLVQNMMVSKFFATFETEVTKWQKLLATIGDVTQMMREVQRSWTFLENLFLCSEEVKRELPQEAERFVQIDESMKEVLRKGESNSKIKDFCVLPDIATQIDELQKQLSLCEKALNEFMDSKRKTFPRFFFVSSVDLLDILSHGNDPPAVMVHMPKIFQAIQQFDWRVALPSDKDQSRPVATGITSCVGTEQLALPEEMAFVGKVESYLQDCIAMMRKTVRHYIKMSFAARWTAKSKDDWIKADPAAQATLLVNMASWVVQVEEAFSKMQETPKAMEECMEKHVEELKSAIKLVQGSLTPALRQKIMCIITIDTHGRDIIQRLLDERASSVDCFQWQSQLKYFWDTETEDVSIRITDAAFAYGYEYLGNGPRLVVTPLTDRIYVTATQALHLSMGCAPAGPAGTGKTETTKDLASALGKACYVFNCSDQMDYQSMANIFKGLAASGSWGCFDEFNRLVPAVLSVCSVQFKSVVDAIKANAEKFFIQGDETALDRTCGVFITMNPGYLGRSELPEGLKALFRPITVVVPDLELICENMLMAEGFVEAKELARKFTRLYALCKDLLSRAAHYDWGLRAIKSVLVVAGTFKREWPELSEQAILMKALRDSNLAKIVADDAKIFQGLLSDLFPGVEPPPQTDAAFSEAVLKVCNDMGLTVNDGLALKALQMRDLLAIRMCVFVMGRPASGKSTVWKVLAKTQDALGSKTTIVDINPKSVSTDELYGYVKMSTREWQDGILSKTMRSLGQIPDTLPKWIVLDGDLDANWIESMNSVMDDNRILTLASNERIPLKPHMRMIFEIRDLKFASPATVSRAGIIFVSDSSGEQWRSYVQSWLQRQGWSEATKADVAKLFEKYCPATLEFVERQCKLSVQVYSLQIIAALCNMLEGLYPEEPQAPEFAFVFCLVWAAGGSLQEKDGIDYRRQFNNWWRSEWKVIKFPSKGSIFEYFVDTAKFESWESQVPTLQFTGREAIDSISVPTAETVSMLHFCKTILKIHAPVMCIGSAGVHLVYFLDDLNMPQLDPYNTQSAIALLRQHMDYQHWLDRNKMQMKDISNTQVLAAMNPTAGSFVVNPRLSRHFWVLNVPMPELTSLFTIYASIMNGFFDVGNFRKAVKEQVMPVIKATMGIYTEDPEKLVLLWLHECERTFCDRLVTPEDGKKYRAIAAECAKRNFGKFNIGKVIQAKNPEASIFAHFGKEGMGAYDRIGSMDELATILRGALNDYNELNPAMDLVLFDDAMHHVCRICRVINNRAGHALVVGVGGSGKQSLTRLSSFISGFATHQLSISSTYDIRDLKNDIRSMYSRAALKDEGVVFLLSDAQIANERFLVYVNDLLASGDIADLYEGDDKEQLMNSIRPLAKAAGVSDSREGCWGFFIDKIRRNLHAVLCLSPVGDGLRTRARKFPALVNCTVIDWFQPWPYEALHSVASKFCAELPIGDEDSTRCSVVEFLPYMFYSVSDAAQTYLEVERRFAYVTPKTFIEAMKLYQTMLLKRISSIEEHSERLSSGLSKLLDTQEKVSALEDDLREKTVAVEEKKAAAEEFAQKVGEEKAKVTAESENANVEALKCAEIQKSVSEQRASCEADLEKAIPLVEQAEAALNTLNKKDFQEAKALNKPPPGVEDITAAVMHLLASVDPIIEVDKQGKLKDKSWKGAQKMMNNPEKFLQTLKDFKSVIDDGRVPEQNFKAVEPLLALPHFNREAIQKKSTAAAGLAEWVVNIYQYYTVVVSVEPKRRALAEATQQLEDANKKLVEVQKLVAELEEKLGQLVAEFDSAIAEKNAVEAEAEKCQRKLDLAQRLMRSLGSEGARWGQTIDDLKEQRRVSVGDVLLSSSFVAYAGVFSKKYRDWLMYEKAVPFLVERGVPLRQPADVLAQLTDEAEMALWNNQGLPSDATSIENGAIASSTERWPLMIDPQLQGRKWIVERERENRLQARGLLAESISLQRQITITGNIAPKGTVAGLEDQLLDLTMQKEQPRLFQRRIHLVQQQNEFTILLAELENTLLRDISSAEVSDHSYRSFTSEQLMLSSHDYLDSSVITAWQGDVLENIELIQNLEKTKRVTTEVSEKVALAKVTEEKLNAISEMYRPVARRGARLFFLLAQLFKIHSFYLFSMESFVAVINRAIDSISEKPQAGDEVIAEPEAENRAGTPEAGLDNTELNGNNPTPEGNCELAATGNSTEENTDKTPAGEAEDEDAQPSGESGSPATDNAECAGTDGSNGEIRHPDQVPEPSIRSAADESAKTEDVEEEDEKDVSPDASRVALLKEEEQNSVTEEEVRLLSQVRPDPSAPPMPEAARGWLSEAQWACCRSLEQLKSFKNNQISLLQNFDQDSLGWARWMAEDTPEAADLPRLFKGISNFEKLLLLRYLRPDRMISALQQFVSGQLGHFFVEPPAIDLQEIEKEADRFTPLFIVLFPGVDPTPVLEITARSKGCTAVSFLRLPFYSTKAPLQTDILQKTLPCNFSMQSIRHYSRLCPTVLNHYVLHILACDEATMSLRLQRTLEEVSTTAHRDFRCVVTSEPPPLRDMQIIPEALLQRSIKIADEAPQDLKANLRRALCCFSQEVVDSCSRPREFKALLFSLCYFHALIIGRKKFGFLGWSRSYSFNEGDLTICGNVIKNYLDKYATIPFEDIRYILGEIMYGGHITDGFDRRLNNTYLANLILPEVLQSYQLGPSFRTPDPAKTEFAAYQKFVEEKTPPENPQVFGLHPNAELGCLSSQSEELFTTLQEVSGVAGGGSSVGRKEDTVLSMVDSLLGKVPVPFDVAAIRAKVKEFHPATVVCLQGALNVTDAMEQLEASLNMSRVPEAWKPYAYESRKQLGPWSVPSNATITTHFLWVNDLLHRVKQLEEWSTDFTLPCPLWISGLFNPMSFLTAVMQVRARAESLALDRMCLRWTVTNIRYGAGVVAGQGGATQQQPLSAPETGVLIHGLFLEGAAWEEGKGDVEGNLTHAQPKVLQYPMPVFLVEAIPTAEVDNTAMYSCPVYLTSARGPTYVTTANLRMSADDSERRWILAGVALTMATDA
ncbi:hypothetical protein EPH_0074210 [Eimeria praecox]|uniref:Uncharacterized protein n=1 Tax=Eimeria praecox TaxID=51316 RepID=U6H7H1_9EIME|nr:hypothetical protein EPH_0074210 [Eimeria praecox]